MTKYQEIVLKKCSFIGKACFGVMKVTTVLRCIMLGLDLFTNRGVYVTVHTYTVVHCKAD